MSDLAFFRFMSNNMLTSEEERHKDEIIRLTEEVLHAKGLQCDASIAKISEDQLKDILDKVRELRKKQKKKAADTAETEQEVIVEDTEVMEVSCIQ
ncbi:hypothetical protein [Nitrososphaera viennensis]|uniref:Uncharacterized protein n=2 Tax=Nitrososphaera viennensis TaxID=1034015 RepID=A0A060HE83_9ARCH|nr:hypothetical protein [Nitrososphaera viennensis]AIC14964.1 hypothetical protein NVIE_007510 [Nitrososphaera viennensis EN76]UVS69899.1 hypothetical protein NWT39_03710 [Nitrososphaera viennensis]